MLLDTDEFDTDATEASDLADLFAAAESDGTEDDSGLDATWLEQATQNRIEQCGGFLEAAFDSLTSEVLDASATKPGYRNADVEVGPMKETQHFGRPV